MRRAWLLAVLVTGCAPAYQGGARPFAKSALREPGWVAVPDVPELRQGNEVDCGPTAAAMVLGYWGQPARPEDLRFASHTPARSGVQAGTLRDILRARGLEAFLVEGTVDDLERELGAGRPVLVGLAKPYSSRVYAHYEVVAGLNRGRGLVATLDPGLGWRQNNLADFLREWQPTHHLMLVVSAPAVENGSGSGPTTLTLQVYWRSPRTVGPGNAPP